MDRPDIAVARRHLFIGCLLLLAGWMVARMFIGHWPMETAIRLAPRWTWYPPVDLPRALGIVWLLVYGLNALRLESKWPVGEDDLTGVGGLYFMAASGLLIGLVATGLGYFAGSWLSLLVVGGMMFALARDDAERSVGDYTEMVLFVAASIGVWTGLASGLLHGFIGLLVYVLTPASRPLARRTASSAAS